MIPEPAKQAARKYPNGTIATSAGTLGTIIVWGATTAGIPMDAAAGAAFATVFAGVASFIGRKGLKGCWDAVWRGASDED